MEGLPNQFSSRPTDFMITPGMLRLRMPHKERTCSQSDLEKRQPRKDGKGIHYQSGIEGKLERFETPNF